MARISGWIYFMTQNHLSEPHTCRQGCTSGYLPDTPTKATGWHWLVDTPTRVIGRHWLADMPTRVTGRHWLADTPTRVTGRHWLADTPTKVTGRHWLAAICIYQILWVYEYTDMKFPLRMNRDKILQWQLYPQSKKPAFWDAVPKWQAVQIRSCEDSDF